jgi:hypothetical protein
MVVFLHGGVFYTVGFSFMRPKKTTMGRPKYANWYGTLSTSSTSDWMFNNSPGTYGKPSVSSGDLGVSQVSSYIKVKNGKPQFVTKGVRLG